MTTTTSPSTLDHSAPTARTYVVSTIALPRGSVLRIHNGRGARIRAARGVLWITEENDTVDHLLSPGEAHTLAHDGAAIVYAQRRARVIVELGEGVAMPQAVDFAPAEGEPGRRIVLAGTPATPVAARAAALIARAVTRLEAALRAMAPRVPRGFAARRRAARERILLAYSDGFPGQSRRRLAFED
jgi:hypothetical protein